MFLAERTVSSKTKWEKKTKRKKKRERERERYYITGNLTIGLWLENMNKEKYFKECEGENLPKCSNFPLE